MFSKRQIGVIGGILCGSGYVICGFFVDTVWQLFLAFTISGVGFGLIGMPSFLIFQEHFEEDFATFTSCVSVFEYAAVALMPPVLQYFKTTYGFNNALVLFGALSWHLVAGCTAFRVPGRKKERHRNNKHQPTSEIIAGNTIPFESKVIDKVEQVKSVFQKYSSLFSSLVAHQKFRYFLLLEGIGFFLFTSWALFLVTTGTALGLSEERAVYLSTAGGIGGFLGKLLAIFLCYINKMNAYTSCLIPLSIIGICMLASTFTTDFYVLCGLTLWSGVSFGVHSTGVFSLLPSMVCTKHLKQAVAIDFTLNGVAVQLGGIVSGMMTGAFGSSLYVFRFDAFLCFLSLPLAVLWAFDDNPTQECNL
ncbi:monocarboxylate transporter 1-like isoform X2 [Apostichopus japonicus]